MRLGDDWKILNHKKVYWSVTNQISQSHWKLIADHNWIELDTSFQKSHSNLKFEFEFAFRHVIFVTESSNWWKFDETKNLIPHTITQLANRLDRLAASVTRIWVRWKRERVWNGGLGNAIGRHSTLCCFSVLPNWIWTGIWFCFVKFKWCLYRSTDYSPIKEDNADSFRFKLLSLQRNKRIRCPNL